MPNLRAQVWIETAVYTLIGLTIIGILLVTLTPQINKMKDRSAVTQMMDALNTIDNKILEVLENQGDTRIVQLKISSGKIEINPLEDSIKYVLESSTYQMSELGQEIKEGNIIVKTEKQGSKYNIYLKLDYNNKINMTFNKNKEIRILQAGATPHSIKIENVGDNSPSEKTHVDIGVL